MPNSLERYAGHIRTAILCDDIRQEKNNKQILIGVFTGNVVFSEFPSAFAPQVYIEFVPERVGEWDFSIRYLLDGELKHEVKGKLDVTTANLTSIPLILPNVVIEVTKPATLELEITIGDNPSDLFFRKLITRGEVTSPTA